MPLASFYLLKNKRNIGNERRRPMDRITDTIYSFPIPLTGNPLKWLNCYVIKGVNDGRNLLIDTGFPRQECISALLSGVHELGLTPENTDVFITHLHTDHAGNAGMLQKMGCRVLMGETDYELMLNGQKMDWQETKIRVAEEGMPWSEINLSFHSDPAERSEFEKLEVRTVKEHEVLYHGGYALECISTPGHTPGHLCLYDREHEIMFTGDHVLFDITPNISFWPTMEDALGIYLENLRKILPYKVKIALPGHRNTSDMTLQERIYQLLQHHEARLAETEQIIANHPGLTGYQIAGLMTWKIHSNSWEYFPPLQKWFATCEAITHLDHLAKCDRIERRETAFGAVYFKK